LLIEDFLQHAEKNGNETSIENLVRYLVEMDIIPEKMRQRFTILKSFRKLYKENGYHKTNTVNDLAVIFECSEKTIWNILKHHPFDFE
jgi:MarR-like DNA-binding transcriptional regulator SgrR of sgrS sRNA